MPVEKRNWYSNIKLIFLILFALLFVGFAIRDIRAGDVSSPLIFAGMLLLIALIFKPWRTGSDEGTPLPRDKKPPSSYLLAPLLLQDSLPSAVPEACDGMVSCHPIVTGVVVVVVLALAYGIWRKNKESP